MTLHSHAQTLNVQYNYDSKSDSILIHPLFANVGLGKNITSEFQLKQSLNKLQLLLWEGGYFESAINHELSDSNQVQVYLQSGKQYLLAEFRQGNIPDLIWKDSRMHKLRNGSTKLSESEILKSVESILVNYENNGFPFAEVGLDSILISNDKVSCALKVVPGPLVRIDSVLVKGNAKISNSFIRSKIGIQPGDIYDESLIRSIDTRIKEVNFLSQSRVYDIFFTQENASIILYLDNKKASQFDGIIGLLSDNETGKIQFTGELKMKLINSFGYGEKMEINWKSPGNLSQNLFIGLNYPFIGGSPIGIDASFSLYKKDTTYIELNRNLGMRYRAYPGLDLKLFGAYQTSDLLSTKQFQFAQVLPDFADVSRTNYGIGIEYLKLDYLFNPRKGLDSDLEISAGNRSIKKIEALPESIYDDIDLKSAQYKAWAEIDYYIPIKKRSTIKLGFKGGGLYGDRFFTNELIRIGGINDLRGFDEESILASAVTIGLVEYRFLLEENAYFALFTNGAWYEKNIQSGYTTDMPWGFGTGLNLETGLGIFSISYALGSEFGNPINFKGGKIHFGLLNSF